MTDIGGGGGGVGSEVSVTGTPKPLEIRTRTVEKTLEPLVMQVSQLLFNVHSFVCEITN